ncbi:hypothetical protein CHS0354_005801 [Potamilus streckersoni]|uniref:FAD-binding PCMH-type domain-containing protein n=1 Tax=Potamilus streckersoni TaxID=2493646 RepID=A0AAE0SUQ2_9BIVA|nr:hypothetical protein CHS0354_005801 [Potamilus streckersoni]
MAGSRTRPKEYIPETEEEMLEIMQKVKKQGGLLLLSCGGIDWSGLPEDKIFNKLDLTKLLEKNLRESPVEPHEPPAKRTRMRKTEASARLGSSLAQDEARLTLNILQAKVGPSPDIIREDFKNWSGTQRASVLSSKPKSLTELQTLISVAKSSGLKVRCAGTKHSWSPIFADQNQLLIYMDKMASDYPNNQRIFMEEVQCHSDTVKVHIMSGVTNEEFKQFQLDNNISLPCNILLTVVQTVSVVVTGSHGVGKDSKCVCDYLEQIRIVDSDGKLRTYSGRPQDDDRMKAVAANFGLFGVVYDVTLRLDNKQPIVKTVNNYSKVQDVFYTTGVLEDMVAKNWSMELFWFPLNSFLFGPKKYSPKNDEVMIRLINPDDKGHNPVGDKYYEWKDIWDFRSSFLLSVFQNCFRNPTFLPYMQSISFVMLREVIYPHKDDLYEKLTNAVHFRKYIHKVPVYDMEFAFDLSEQNNCNIIRKACQAVIEEVERRRCQGKFPLNIAMEMRWMSYSDSYLSPASIVSASKAKDPKVIYIEVLSLTDTKGWDDFCRVIATAWMKLGGVPHLAKQWDFLSGVGIDIDNYIRQRFGDRINQFKDQLQQSKADPERMFFNTKLEQLLYPKK